MSRFLIICSIFLSSIQLIAQRPVELSTESTDEGFEIVAVNKSHKTMTVKINFTQLMNLRVGSGQPYVYTVPPGQRTIARLSRTDGNSMTSLNYSYTYIEGCVNTKPDRDILYLIPASPGSTVKFMELSNLREQYGDSDVPPNWYAVGFKMNKGDTVYASRRGRITEMDDSFNSAQGGNLTYVRDENFIKVQHDDCTIAKYSSFLNGSVFVKPGEDVEAGQPLGIAGGENYSVGTHVKLMVYFLNPDEDVIGDDNDANNYVYQKLFFARDGQNGHFLRNGEEYESAHYDEVIMMEMSKKQRKRYLEQKSGD